MKLPNKQRAILEKMSEGMSTDLRDGGAIIEMGGKKVNKHTFYALIERGMIATPPDEWNYKTRVYTITPKGREALKG